MPFSFDLSLSYNSWNTEPELIFLFPRLHSHFCWLLFWTLWLFDFAPHCFSSWEKAIFLGFLLSLFFPSERHFHSGLTICTSCFISQYFQLHICTYVISHVVYRIFWFSLITSISWWKIVFFRSIFIYCSKGNSISLLFFTSSSPFTRQDKSFHCKKYNWQYKKIANCQLTNLTNASKS